MLRLPSLPKLATSADQIAIESIEEGVIKLSDNSYRIILETTSINFELKSEEEQDMLIDIYEGFLNSVGFPIQFLLRTRELDIAEYLASINDKVNTEKDNIYKDQLQNYRNFVSSLVTSNKILSRHFYIVIAIETSDDLKDAVADQLSLRADIVSKNLSRLGIVCKTLSSLDVIDLFYSFYSPERSKSQPISRNVITFINEEFVTRSHHGQTKKK